MKHESDQDLKCLLRELSAEAGIQLGDREAIQLVQHLEWVLATNQVMNLTSIRDPSEGLRLHVVDSLTALGFVNQAPDGILVDIGTGGGFPGIPLAICSGRTAVLLDSVQKKANAVQECARSLSLPVSVVGERAEDYAAKSRETAACVVARALATLPSLVELAAPLLIRGGLLICLKGRLEGDELGRGIAAGRLCGLGLRYDSPITLPRGPEQRRIIVFERQADSAIRLPRRVGLAQRRPLA